MDDQFAGQGGAYEIDPETGERKLIERTQEPEALAPETTEE